MNNWTTANEDQLVALGQSVTYLVFGYEEAESGTPHLQGYVTFPKVKRFNEARQFLPHGTHLEAKRGTPEQAASYCKKGGVFKEFGKLVTPSGRNTLFDDFSDWILRFVTDKERCPSEREIAREYPVLFVRYGRKMRALAEHLSPQPVIETGTLRKWQDDLERALLEPCDDDRSILFYVDNEGGTGKSWFQRYMVSKHTDKVQLLSPGRRDDVAHAIDDTKSIFLFNVPRGGMEYFNYQVVEMLKDRVVFSPKYDSKTKVLLQIPHVVVFCNEDPDTSRMTEDRFIIIEEFEP